MKFSATTCSLFNVAFGDDGDRGDVRDVVTIFVQGVASVYFQYERIILFQLIGDVHIICVYAVQTQFELCIFCIQRASFFRCEDDPLFIHLSDTYKELGIAFSCGRNCDILLLAALSVALCEGDGLIRVTGIAEDVTAATVL